MNASPALLYYGDDFTGATDALATARRAGLRSLLLLEVPDEARLRSIGEHDCLGIAGSARSMTPAEMRDELAPVAALARRLRPRVLHYKTCSTFDSAPAVGNIGEAVRVLQPATGNDALAIVGGQPNLGRYCLFGHLFAAAGTGGNVFRLDRHPTMSRHPVTPMYESDLRAHLAAQQLRNIGLVPWTLYAAGDAALAAHARAERDAGRPMLLWDVAEPAHLLALGRRLLAESAASAETAGSAESADRGLLAVGPSSVTEAVAGALRGTASACIDAPGGIAAANGPVLALAGSLSPITARQVAGARSFDVVRLDAERLVEADGGYRSGAARDLAARLGAGRHALACTVPPGGARAPVASRTLAHAGGLLLAEVLQLTPVKRIGVAGGDTSSHAVQALDAWGLSFAGLVAPGAPLCTLRSASPVLDGVQLMLKGGQMGGDDIFERLVAGTK
ncbi:MAG: four-carbon acid sugar kinase family protein [Proteobacteria bacterium]|nr:four-carbon acid sugar kinase family protein [Pseudomonadota bacterium]